jgi:molybdopterin-guanine dinucleotide biosynthesis protein A
VTEVETTAVVLAGGHSRRLQVDKAFLKIGEKYLIQRVLDVVTPLFASVLINSPAPELYQEWDLPVIQDVWPEKGALGGIYTALKYARTSHVFCVACDMPFLNAELIKAMMKRAQDYDALIPQTPDGFHPLHAIYSTRCISPIESLLREDRLKISNLFPLVNACYFTTEDILRYDTSLESFANLNTWQDVEAARQRVEAQDRRRMPLPN